MSRQDSSSFSRCLSGGQLLELDACTQCGECLKYCPVQEVTGDRSVSPPEKIRNFKDFIKKTGVLRQWLFGKGRIDEKLLQDFTKAVFECTTCGACGEACTVGIHTQRLWPMLRREMVKRGLGPIDQQKEAPEAVGRTGNPYDRPAGDRFSWRPPEVKVAQRAKLGYYAGCTGAYDATPMVRGDVQALSRVGEPFTMLPAEEEVCCGFPLFITGQFELLEGLVKKLVEAYAKKGVKTLICSCPCCVNMISRDWPSFYGRRLPFGIMHISQYIDRSFAEGRLSVNRTLDERLIYHDPCYLSRGVGITEEPRRVLERIPGAQLLEFERNRVNSRCCGAGGAARKVFRDNALAIFRLAINEACEKKADRLVLGCPACYSIAGAALEGHDSRGKNGGQLGIVDVMELLAEVF